MLSAWTHEAVHWMQEIQSTGWAGCFLFVGLYALACLLFIPASILTLGAGAIYGFWEGCAIVLLGNALGSLFSLLITRYLLRGWIAGQVLRHPGIKLIQKAVKKKGWRIVFLTRLSPIMPFSLINYALGLTDISALHFLFATIGGALPSICVYTYFGTLVGNLAMLGSEMRHPGLLQWLLRGLGLVATILVTIYIARIASRSLKSHLPSED